MATDTTGGKTEEDKASLLSNLPKEVSLDLLRKMTDNFSKERELVTNGFGTLYKAISQGTDRPVFAVKKLSANGPVPRKKAFTTEVQNIIGLEHENIIKLVGFCCEGQAKLVQNNGKHTLEGFPEYFVCYEHLPNGDLHGKFFDKSAIDWETQFKIIKGICHGLQHLHGLSIVHMDLKPENIWLDENLVPKIVNFGLSTPFGQQNQTIRAQNIVGSYGYMAPEYHFDGESSVKTDIYGLGLLIMEITTRNRNSSPKDQPSGRKYIDKIREEWTEEKISLKYSSLDADCLQEVNTCIRVGLKCVEINPVNRPSIDNVIDQLFARCAS